MEESMAHAFTIALTGMSVVFSFLVLLVFVLHFLAKALTFLPASSTEQQTSEDPDLLLRKVAAIAVSIHCKRNSK